MQFKKIQKIFDAKDTAAIFCYYSQGIQNYKYNSCDFWQSGQNGQNLRIFYVNSK